MLILRIKRAEAALADGRLDEAYEIATSQDVRAHARGQKLIGQLVRALVERGRALLDEERLPQALADCEKAARLGGNLPEVCALRTGIMAGLHGQGEQARRRDQALQMGREHVAKGQLSLAGQVLAPAAEDHAPARALLQEVETRRVAAEAALERARAAMGRRDWPAAIAALLEARGQHAANRQLAEACDQVCGGVLEEIREVADSGRLDLARGLLERLRPVAPESLEVQAWSGVLEQCQTAARLVSHGEFRRAADTLRRLRAGGCQLGWLEQALHQAEQAAQAAEGLASGPLGWLLSGAADADRTVLMPEHGPDVHVYGQELSARDHGQDARATPDGQAVHATGLPGRMMFHVDAVGSFLVLPAPVVRIGPARRGRGAAAAGVDQAAEAAVGGTEQCDVALAADPALPAVTIERVEDDYFLSCERPVRVNDASVTRKLLSNGDQILLSPRCRIRFELPHPASTTAVLSLSGTRLVNSDARRVVLMDRAMVMGPGSHAHVRADALREPAVIVASEGRLICRTGEAVMVDDRPMDRVSGLKLGARIRVGAVQFVVKAVS